MDTFRRRSKKILIAILGGTVTLAGLVMVPYPGPGWLVVFAGLAILSTEFLFASKILKYAKGKYEQWKAWLKRQHWAVQVLALALTGSIVLVTLWLLNAFGIINAVLGLGWDWVVSPLF